jgi:hypothetical protein
MTKLGCKRTTPQLPLRRKTGLKSKKGINNLSDRAKKEMVIWRKLKLERAELMRAKFDCVICEYCKRMIIYLELTEGHHNNHNRRQNEPWNLRLVHSWCNIAIEDNNVKDVPSLL